jgi:hypothetical protein
MRHGRKPIFFSGRPADVVQWPMVAAEIAVALNHCSTPSKFEAKAPSGASRGREPGSGMPAAVSAT